VTCRISHTSVDSRDAFAQSVWWAEVLGMIEDPDDPNEPGDEECMILSPDRQIRLLFLDVPEGKSVKNRIHLDLRPIDRTRDEEVARVLSLGATQLADRRRSDGTGWVVLADPEGNEFCILRSDAELAAGQL
jgi:Glyoxalase-like domain